MLIVFGLGEWRVACRAGDAMPETKATGWRVAWGPGQDEEDADEWLVVLRLDDLERDAEGPQIVGTSTAKTYDDFLDPEDGSTHEAHCFTTRFEFQVWDRDGSLVAVAEEEAPYSWHGWEAEFGYARDVAMQLVQDVAKDPRWNWDGTAESKG